MTEPLFVAEIKINDPFTQGWAGIGTLLSLPEKLTEAVDLAVEYGDIISVHTSGAWGGGWDLLDSIRLRTDKPILAKGAHMFGFEIDMALARGANYVLTMNSEIVSRSTHTWEPQHAWIDALWWEAHNVGDYPFAGTTVYNARSLVDGRECANSYWYRHDVEKWALGSSQMHPEERDHTNPHNSKIVQASFIKTPEDIIPNVYAYIVGTHLKEFIAAKFD